VNNGGYEGVYIFIREGVEENDNLIRRIKVRLKLNLVIKINQKQFSGTK
jgi:hypothetical protein